MSEAPLRRDEPGADPVDRLVREAVDAAAGDRPRCPFCGLRFRWPGLLESHLIRVHPYEVADVS